MTDQTADILQTRIEMGRTRDLVECACGQCHWAYRWSWAGNGFTICKGCGSQIWYGNLKVTPKVEK